MTLKVRVHTVWHDIEPENLFIKIDETLQHK